MKTISTIALIALIIWLTSCGTNSSHNDQTDKPSPIDTSYLVKINGVDQYLEIKGHNKQNPVLLFIHGGPAWPMTPFSRSYNKNLYEDFVVVNWDQRNCGKSQVDSLVPLNIDLYVSDAYLVTQELKKTFNTDKIFLVCHSWGTAMGVRLISKYPSDYYAYVGVGQVVDMKKGCKNLWDFVETNAKAHNDTAVLNALKKIPFTAENGFANGRDGLWSLMPLTSKYAFVGGDTSIPFPATAYKDYNFDKLVKDADRVEKVLESYTLNMNLESFTDFKIPIYFFVGKYDNICPLKLVEQYSESIKAPSKEVVLFDLSAHSPIYDEPDKFKTQIKLITDKYYKK